MIDLSKKLVLFDRDGVLNEDRREHVRAPEELLLFDGALAALADLTRAGIRIGICTNQSGIERGYFDEAMLTRIHQYLCARAATFGARIDRIVFCASADNAHPWRKPNAGMLLEQARYFAVDLKGVPFVGDNIIDVQAARAAGAQPVLVKTGKGRLVAKEYAQELSDVLVYDDVQTAIKDWL